MYNVGVVDNWFVPVRMRISVGDVIQWQYQTGVAKNAHTVTTFTGAPESFSRGMNAVPPNDRFARAFTKPGTYRFYCKNHGNTSASPDASKNPWQQPCVMCGVIEVRSASGSGSSATTAPTTTAAPTSAPAAPAGGITAATPGARVTSAPASTSTPSASPTALAAPVPSEQPAGAAGVVVLAIVGVLAIGVAGAVVWWRRRSLD